MARLSTKGAKTYLNLLPFSYREGKEFMNVIQLLKEDHESVSALFKSYEAAKESKSEAKKMEIVQKIREELSAHAEAEEEIFYPAVESRGQEDEKAQDTVKEAHEEHKLVKTLLAELEDMSAGDEQFDAKVKVLKDIVEHHVEEEEGQMMPKAKKLLTSEELEDLGKQVEARKEELMAEPVGRANAASRNRSSSSSESGRESSSRPRASSSKPSGRSSSRSVKASRSPRPARKTGGGSRSKSSRKR